LVGYNQPEPTFTLNQIAMYNFGKLLKPSRNILMVKYGDKNEITSDRDRYAAPQQIVTITAKDDKSLMEFIKNNEKKIVNSFRNFDFGVFKSQLTSKTWDPKNVETFRNLKANITMPYAYRKVYDTLNYIWFKKEIPRGSLNLQMYTLPITSEADLNGENIIEARNAKGKEYIVGTNDGTYMVTEEAFTPFRFDVTIDNKKAYETRGTWEMVDTWMAGTFVNYTVIDKVKNRLIVVEGFVYAPNTKKRDYMFELEAILKTLKIE